MSKFTEYQEAAREVTAAEAWHALPDSKHRYKGDSFDISPVHSSMSLTRAGQHSAGDNNYHKSPKSLNVAILAVIAEDPTVIDKALDRMREQTRLKLIACEVETSAQMDAIKAAKAK